jgi:hypothetical protein
MHSSEYGSTESRTANKQRLVAAMAGSNALAAAELQLLLKIAREPGLRGIAKLGRC